MQNYAMMLSSILIMLIASFVAVYSGQWLLGFGLFILAVTPVPVAAGYRIRDGIVHATRRVRGHAVGARPR